MNITFNVDMIKLFFKYFLLFIWLLILIEYKTVESLMKFLLLLINKLSNLLEVFFLTSKNEYNIVINESTVVVFSLDLLTSWVCTQYFWFTYHQLLIENLLFHQFYLAFFYCEILIKISIRIPRPPFYISHRDLLCKFV